MPRKEFIEQARQALTKQKEDAERAQKIKLHDADVIGADGPTKWNALTDELQNIVKQLNDSAGPEMEYKVLSATQVQVFNKISKSNVTVTFQKNTAKVDFGGSGNAGGFLAKVQGSDLVYTANVSQYPYMGLPSTEYSIQEMAEKMTKGVIGIP